MQWNTARLIALCTLCASANAAVVSLFLPQADGLALSADPVGTDAQGHTTWIIGPGVVSGTLTPAPLTPFPIATVVQGATDVHAMAAFPKIPGGVVQDNCGIVGNTAVCTVILAANGVVVSTEARAQLATPVPVQVADPAASVSNPTGTPTAAATTTAPTSAASPSSVGGAATNSTGAAGTGSGAVPTTTGSSGAEKVMGGVYYMPFVVALASVVGGLVL